MASPIVLHVEQYGTGTPVVLLMHGFAGSARNFRGQARALESRYRVVFFDLRGHARSEAPVDPAEYLPNAFIGDVERVLEDTGVDTAIVGGLSMGASIALRYAFERPERVRALVIASFPPAGDRSASSWALRFADAIDARGVESAGSEFVWGGDRFDNRAANFIRQGFLEHRAHALAAILRNTIATQPAVSDLRERIASLDIPALLVAGSNDGSSLAPTRELARTLPRAHFEVIPEAGHVPNLEKPKIFNEILMSFLREFDA